MGRLSFLMACLLSTLYVLAQGPGGVSGAELWHIATVNSTDTSYVWKDYSGDDVQFRSINDNQLIIQPQSWIQSFNFHPALHFDSISGNSILGHTNLAQTTVIGVFAPDEPLYQQIAHKELLQLLGRDGEDIRITTDSVKDKSHIDLHHSYYPENYSSFPELALRTITYQRSNMPNHSVWGEPTLSFLRFNETNRLFTGYCPELIVYGRMLSQKERRKVETYLAIKYGITLWGSYFAPNDDLIWDNNQAYHNRVTAIANYTNSLLSQPLSTTSYEEDDQAGADHRYAFLPENDSFYQHSPYNKPTQKRLLVLGHEYGFNIPNNSYMIWGDDGGPITLSDSTSTDSLWNIMGRIWKLSSNMPSRSSNTTSFTTDNIFVTPLCDGLYSIHRPVSESQNSSVTFGPQTEDDLHLSFVCPEAYPTFSILVNKSNENKYYGFEFDSIGNIKTVAHNGSSTLIMQNAMGHQIDFYKKGKTLYLQIDGEGHYGNKVVIPTFVRPPVLPIDTIIRPDFPIINGISDEESVNGDGQNVLDSMRVNPIELRDFYNVLLDVKKGTTLNINSFRVDGFSDTGNQLELSYNIASDLRNYRKNRTILLVNKTESFVNPNEVDKRIACTDFDVDRQKLMFHNIFFKDSINYFTFGTYDGMFAELTPVRAHCDDAPNTGQIIIDIKCGSPLYNVKLKDLSNNLQTRDSTLSSITPNSFLIDYNFGTNHVTIDSLQQGVYELYLTQVGGNNIYACPYPSDDRFYSIEFEDGPRSISWLVTDTLSNYVAGFTDSQTGELTAGFQINGSMASSLNNVTDSMNVIIAPGDSIAVSINRSTLQLFCKGSTLTRTPVDCTNVFRAEFQRGEATLANVQIIGDTLGQNSSHESVLFEKVSNFMISKQVFIGTDCDSTTRNEIIDLSRPTMMNQSPRKTVDDETNRTNGLNEYLTNNGALKVTPQGGQEFTAELASSDTGIAQLLVFDTLGRLVAERTMTGVTVKTVSFTVPAFGVYIVKVLTDHEEYSEKILCK